jgi:hypothetical protein
MTLWDIPAGRAERLALARGYPFEIPTQSFLFRGGGALPLAGAPDLRGRTPVLAIGSNQSPHQLARKFAHDPDATIPVTRAWLGDFDICYATHVTRYGAIPGNLHACAGMRVRLSITWLDVVQLRVMHATEIVGENYVFARLDGLDLETDEGKRVTSALAYVSPYGAMAADGQPLGLAAMVAERRPHPAALQPAALALLQLRCRATGALDDFILASLDDETERRRRTELLRSDAIAFAWPNWTAIDC